MKALDPTLEVNLRRELQWWREATSIFMTSGHGGCSPHRPAVAARFGQRRLPAALIVRSRERFDGISRQNGDG
jgi:hypothetical protein